MVSDGSSSSVVGMLSASSSADDAGLSDATRITCPAGIGDEMVVIVTIVLHTFAKLRRFKYHVLSLYC